MLVCMWAGGGGGKERVWVPAVKLQGNSLMVSRSQQPPSNKKNPQSLYCVSVGCVALSVQASSLAYNIT